MVRQTLHGRGRVVEAGLDALADLEAGGRERPQVLAVRVGVLAHERHGAVGGAERRLARR